jgi:microcompartment protein CcmL/EutN
VEVLGLQEFSSIATGIQALDAMVKAAPVRILVTRIVCPGKYVILITGDVASVEASLVAGRRDRGAELVDELFLPNLHPAVIPAIRGPLAVREWDALGIIESLSVAGGVLAADAAAKEAAVEIPELRLAGGMGGKSTVKVMGGIHDVEAAVAAGVRQVAGRGLLCRQVILARPHPDIQPFVLRVAGEDDGIWN